LSRPWTKEDYEYLEEHWGVVSIPTIAQNLNRSIDAIKIKAHRKRLGSVLESGDYISLNQLIKAVTGLSQSYTYHMTSWAEKRGLPVHTKRVNKNSFRVVYIDEFWEWAEKNRSYIDFSRMEPLILGEEPAWVAEQRKKDFEALLAASLKDECSLEVVQTVHDQLRQCIEMHKESKVAEPLLISKEQVRGALAACGVSEQHMAQFSLNYDEAFGFEAELHPKNIIDNKKFEIHTPDVSIRVDPTRSDLIETRVIGGVKYILICAEEDVEVNGVSIHIGEQETAIV